MGVNVWGPAKLGDTTEREASKLCDWRVQRQ